IFPYMGTSPNGGVSVPVLLTSDWSPRTHWTRSGRRSGPVAEALGAEPSAVVPKDPPAPDAPLEVVGRSSQASSSFHFPTVEQTWNGVSRGGLEMFVLDPPAILALAALVTS